jgi:rfaE bifunctional protein nucleotidyltransferase chain/domain
MMPADKLSARSRIVSLDQLNAWVHAARNQGLRVVHCHGVFDMLHLGHMRHFEKARSLGDRLVVTVTPDCYVNKGPHRPVFGEQLRAEAVAALTCVDMVAINRWPTAIEVIRLLEPDCFVKGSEFKDTSVDLTGAVAEEKAAVEALGGQMVFTEDLTFSSSHLINRHLQVFSPEASTFLASLASRLTLSKILGYLKAASKLKVLIVGESIVDEYVYCESIGKAGKEPVLAALQQSSEKFAGGSLSVVNHLAGFCSEVALLTVLGGRDSQEDFIRAQLNPAVQVHFLYQEGAPTIVKRRYMEMYPFQRLFEIYEMNDEIDDQLHRAFCGRLSDLIGGYDLVIVCDHGHGLIGSEAVRMLHGRSRFLAVSAQMNAGNYGFHTISKYPRSDYFCLTEREARLDVRSRGRRIEEILEELSVRLNCPQLTLTRGQLGCLCYRRGEGFLEAPALALKVVDRTGAGNAVLAVSSLFAVQEAPLDLLGFMANVAGAHAVATVGYRQSINPTALVRTIESLLK